MGRSALLVLSLALAWASAAEAIHPRYPETLASIDAKRTALAARLAHARGAKPRAAVLDSARGVAFHAIVDDILPAWYGTPWAFYGTTETPREGTIACGYLVTTVLRDAGFKVERETLAQQASEKIVKTMSPEGAILRFRNEEQAAVVAGVRKAEGDGLYVVGMDYHVGLLVISGERADLCHSAVLEPAAVTCEPAETAAAFASRYYVIGPALSDARVEDWLAGRAIATAKR